jgi:hypothetical protein
MDLLATGQGSLGIHGAHFGNQCTNVFIIIIIIIHGLGSLTCSGIDALQSFPVASTVSSPSRVVAEGAFRKSGVVHSFEMGDPVLLVAILRETNWSSKNGGFADGLVTLPRKIMYS